MDIDDVNVRFNVIASFSVTLGLYSGPITQEMIAEAINERGVYADDLAITLDAIVDDHGKELTP